MGCASSQQKQTPPPPLVGGPGSSSSIVPQQQVQAGGQPGARRRCGGPIRGLETDKAVTGAVQIFVVTDPGQDLDDEMAFVVMRQLEEEGLVHLVGAVCTLAPAFERARLLRGTLDLLGMHS